MSCSNAAIDEVSASRRRLMANAIGVVESLSVTGPPAPRSRAESYSPDFQVCLPYHGAFVWHVGKDDVLADPNRVLFVAGDEGFRLSRPVPGGYAELIITVHRHVLAEMLGVSERLLGNHTLFRERSRQAETGLQRLGAWCLHHGSRQQDDLAGEEWLVAFLGAAVTAPSASAELSPSTARLVARAARDFPAEHEPCPAGSDRALDGAIMTAPSARDPELLKKLDAVAGRVLKA